jgi:serine/threonine-protein kinase RsbW
MNNMTLQIEANVEAPSLTRSRLASIRQSLEPRYEDVLLVVSELVSNCVRHTDTDDIAVHVEANNGHVRVEVSDRGPGFTPSTPRRDGLGLTIIEKLAENWGMAPAGDSFTVWAELKL